jgi:phytoene dehydrogenase-like protein
MSKHYDVVVLGTELGPLAAAALLARRSWRVLVLGQGARGATYTFDGLPLARRPSSLLAGSSPAWTRVLVELAQSQTFRRRVVPVTPMLQVLLPRRRFELPPDGVAFGRECDREFPEVRRVIDDLYAELARTNASADTAFERDVMWPPGGFWERRETARALTELPHTDAQEASLLAEFPRGHDYRTIVAMPAHFASDLAGELPAFALARLHGAWTRGVVRLPGGDDELRDFLLERVKAHGGDVALGDRAAAIAHRGGKVKGVLLDGDEHATGVQFLVADTTHALLDLAEGFTPSQRAAEAMPRTHARTRRFVVTIVVRDRGLPAMLAHDVFLAPGEGDLVGPIHVQRWSRQEADGIKPWSALPEGTSLLALETLVDVESPLPIAQARAAVLSAVERAFPFIERHYLVVDSPHDGAPLWDYRGGKRALVDRALVRQGGGSVDAEPMVAQFEITPTCLCGLGGEALRAPLDNGFVVGRTTMPALGQEGQLLSAWGVARAITKTDRKKEKMRRELWSKVELG